MSSKSTRSHWLHPFFLFIKKTTFLGEINNVLLVRIEAAVWYTIYESIIYPLLKG